MINEDIQSFLNDKKFNVVYADPPWKVPTGSKKSLNPPYEIMNTKEISKINIRNNIENGCHLYLWVPNSMLKDGLAVMKAWGFAYKLPLIWHKIRKDGKTSGQVYGHYFRNSTEICLFGTYKKNKRTLNNVQNNVISTQKREHSRKPDEMYELIEKCSEGPFLELFGRNERPGWTTFGNQTTMFNISNL